MKNTLLQKPLMGLMGLCSAVAMTAAPLPLRFEWDTFQANGIIKYDVPADAPQSIIVQTTFALADGEFKPAAVNPYRSETAIRVLSGDIQKAERKSGKVTELYAAGRTRTLIWQTSGQLPAGAISNGKLHVTLADPAQPETILAENTIDFQADLSQVIMLDNFAKNPNIYPNVISEGARTVPGWCEEDGVLSCYEKDDLLDPIVWRGELSGDYAIYVNLPPNSVIELELTDDGYPQRFEHAAGRDVFWKVAKMNGRHLVFRQCFGTIAQVNDATRSRLRHVKFVKLTPEQAAAWNRERNPARDKITAGYFEPYSWSFIDLVDRDSKFLEALAAYADARVDIVDAQAGRGGCTPFYPSAVEPPLLGVTVGDPAPGNPVPPKSEGTGRMARTCDLVTATLRAARAYDIQGCINFGAAINYKGEPIEGRISKEHPEYFINTYYYDYDNPAARAYFLQFYRELMERGARTISVDFCRYPFGCRSEEGVNLFFRELRALANGFTDTAKGKITIMTRFPVPGSYGADSWKNVWFNPALWAAEGLVDIIMPSNLYGVCDFDVKPYVEAVKGTGVKVLPNLEGGSDGLAFPYGPMFQAARHYRDGADGVYMYQSDARIVGGMTTGMSQARDVISILGSSQATIAWVEREKQRNREEYSCGVYMYDACPYRNRRVVFYFEGIEPDKVEFYVKGELLNTRTQEPWILGELGDDHSYTFTGKNIPLKLVIHFGDTIWEHEITLPQML